MSMFYGGVLEGEKLKNESKAESDIINEEEPYEVLHQVNCDIENQSPSISQVRRSRDVGDLGNCGGGMRDSLIGFKEGVPGVYSGFKLGHNRMRRRKSAPVIIDENSIRNPTRPPRTHRPKSSSQLAVIYDTVYDKGGSLDFESDWLAQQKVADMDGQHVILETGENMTRVETGIRFYDPRTDSPTRPISTVVLPMSLDDDMSDSAESWGSDFDDEDVEEDEIYEVVGQPREKVGTVESDYEDVDVLMEKHDWKKPPLPPRHSIIFESLSDLSDMEKDTYIPVQMDSEQQLVQLPPLSQYAENYQVKRYQIVKCIIENEKIYMKSLNKLIKEYEEPLLERKLISNDRVKVIFKHVHEILQCHQLFNMALSDRASEWETKEVIGDVIYASFSKSTVLKAYSSFISNFSMAMESIKETCKLVPAFLKFLKVSTNELSTCYNTIRKAKKFKSIKFNSIPINNRLYRHNTKQSLYDLMRQPLERIPQLVLLTQALVKVTPLLHPDRPPLQMALTHLECLSETLAEKRKDTMCKHKVRQLDGYCTGLDKPLASKKRYYIRHDDMLLCLVEDNKVVKTKLRRIIILNDLIICASILNKQKRLKLMTKKKYKVKWCIPIHDVNIIDVGSGISINIDKKTTTIKYSHSISSPRPGGKQSSQLIEDLQHDIALIGEIGGKVASLRRTYRFLDTKKVNNWFKDVKALLDRETEIANMNWIELSIPMRNQENERMRCLFNVHSPKKKLEWSAELENVKLRLAHNNNPGWFLQEENIYDGETAVLRRTLPLVSNMVPLFMIEQKYSVQCVLDVSDTNMAHPMFWVFSGNEHVGLITLMEMNMTSEPHVVESFVACKARICCAELSHENADSNYKPKSLVWIGTMSGSILLFEPRSGEEEPFASANLKDSVITLKYSCGNMFAGMANGTLACFQRKVDGSWNLENPTIICLGVKSILTLTEAARRLWCACGSHIFVLDTQTLGIEKKIDTCEKGKNDVKHLVAYGIGVWSSSWKSSKLELYHAETLQQLQTINIATPVSRMKNEIDGRIQNINVDKIYVTALLAEKGLLWVGTNLGLIVTYPLPRLGGIPTVSGQACVSLHIHEGPVKHLHSFKVWKQLKKVEQDHEQNEVKSVLNVDMFSDSISEMETSMEVVQQNTSSEPMYFLVDPSAENQYGGTGSYEPSSDVLVHEVDERLAVDNDYLEEQIEEVKKSDNDAVNNDDVKNDGVNIGDNRNDDEKNDSVKNDGETPTSAKTTTTEGMTTNVVADVTEGEITDNKKEKVDTDSTKPSRRETYDSDDDVTADQDFSFLEDEKNGYQFQSSKPGEDFSVYIEKDKAVVKSMLNTLPALKENGFVEMMEKFAGFSTNPLQSSTPSKPSDNVQSNIVDISCKKEGVISVPERDLSSNAPPASTETITTNGPVEADDAQTSETSGERRNEEEMNCSHGKTTDACEDCEEMKFQSDSGYELPFQLDPLPVTQPYAVINKMTDNGMENAVAGQTESESSSDIVDTNLQNPALESFYDQYKDLPLPKSPSNSVNLRNSSNPCASKTPVGSYTDKGIYTPLLISENLSTSLTSSIGLRAYEKEMSLNESSSVRETNESYYASLVSVSKREEETRSLLTPSYVVSVGMGHIDLRKKVRPMSGLDIFRSFSQDVCEPLLIIWKLS